jgi:hypothetical protein
MKPTIFRRKTFGFRQRLEIGKGLRNTRPRDGAADDGSGHSICFRVNAVADGLRRLRKEGDVRTRHTPPSSDMCWKARDLCKSLATLFA